MHSFSLISAENRIFARYDKYYLSSHMVQQTLVPVIMVQYVLLEERYSLIVSNCIVIFAILVEMLDSSKDRDKNDHC
jgi:hypothetical protein